MKHRHVFEILTETYEEEQFMLDRFPEAWWEIRGVNAVFVLPLNKQKEAEEAIEEFEQLKKEAGVK